VLSDGTRLEVPEGDPAVLRMVVETVLRQAATSILKGKRYRLRGPQRSDRELESDDKKAQVDAPGGTNCNPARGAARGRWCLNQRRPIHHNLFFTAIDCWFWGAHERPVEVPADKKLLYLTLQSPLQRLPHTTPGNGVQRTGCGGRRIPADALETPGPDPSFPP
jgi:hypothetical protein